MRYVVTAKMGFLLAIHPGNEAMLKSSDLAIGKDRVAVPPWMHWTVTGTLILGALILDLVRPLGLSLSIFYFLPAVYAAWAVRGRAKQLCFAIVFVALFLVPVLARPNSVTIDGMLNRCYGVVVGVFVLYSISERHRLVATLQLANHDLEERVAARTAELQKTNASLCQEVEDRKQAVEALVNTERRFRDLYESSRDAIFVEDSAGNVRDVNPAACRLHGLTREQLLSKNVRDLIPKGHSAEFDRDFVRLFNGELTQIDGFSLRADGKVVPVELSASRIAYIGQPSLLLHVRDVTERNQSEALVNGQKQVLELIASGQPVADSLTALLRIVEEQSAGMLCSILLLDAEGIHLRHGAAPSLPLEYCRAIDGVAIGPGVGSCGTAAYQREPVIVADIATDPLWADYRDLALHYGLRACWSTPIFGATRRVLGTFAMYYRQPARPNEHQLRLIDMATHTAAIAISKHQEEAALHATQAALQASEQRLFKLFRNSPDAVAVVSLPEGRLIDVNDQFVELTGYSRAEVFSRTTLELGLWENPAEREQFYQLVREPAGTRLFEATLRIKSGELREMQFSSEMIELDGRTCAMTSGRDVTAQKRAEQALNESQARLRLLVQAANVGLWDWNVVTNENYFSPEWKRLLGYADHEISHRFEEWESRLHPDDRPRTLAAVNDFLTGRRPDYDVEFRLHHKDGSWRWILARADMIRDTSGNPVRMLGCHVDITERKRTEEALREREQQLRLFVEHSPAAIVMMDRDMRYLVASQRWFSDYRLDAQSHIGRSHYDIFPEISEAWKEIHRRCLAGAIERCDEDPFPRADGTIDWVRWEIRPWHTTQGDVGGLIIFSEVINERKRANAELTASRERLEMLSRQLIATQESERRHLARELHDEIGQSLTGIKLNLKALQHPAQVPKSSSLVQDTIDVVDQTLLQVRSLALDLRPSMLDDIGLVAALRWCLNRQSQRAGFAPHFVAESAVSGASPEINTACFRIAQESLTNVSRHAQARNVRVEIRQLDRELELLVSDDGIGFDVPAARDRASHGASLGLLGMQERVQLVGGQFEIESNPSGGTTVRARFPMMTND